MNPQSIFHVLTANSAQVLAISNAIGIQALISLAPHLAAIEKSYSAGGIIAVLEHNGPDVQKIIVSEAAASGVAAMAADPGRPKIVAESTT